MAIEGPPTNLEAEPETNGRPQVIVLVAARAIAPVELVVLVALVAPVDQAVLVAPAAQAVLVALAAPVEQAVLVAPATALVVGPIAPAAGIV